MAAEYGRTLMPHQAVISDVAGEVRPDGRMVFPIVIVLMPRRGGKTDLMLPTAIQRVSIAPGSRARYTAQTGGDAGEQMREEWIPRVTADDSGLAPLVKASLRAGREGIWLPGRRAVTVFAATETGGHGKDTDLAIVDEVWSRTLEEGELLDAAIRPTMATRPRRQMWYVSAGGTDQSTWLLALRELGRRLVTEGRCREAGVAYFEWHPAVDEEDQVVDDMDDPAVWLANHPAAGRTIDLDFLRSERASLGRTVFDRSYCNVFQTSDKPRILPELGWRALQDPDAVPAGPLVIAFDVDENLGHGSIVTVGRDAGDQLVAELVDYRPGTAWMAGRLADLRRRHGGTLTAAADGPPSGVVADLVDAGERVRLLSSTERQTADGELVSTVLGAGGPPLRIRPAPILDRAAGGVEKRQIADGFILARARSAGDVSPVIALSAGRHVAEHATLSKPRIRTGTR